MRDCVCVYYMYIYFSHLSTFSDATKSKGTFDNIEQTTEYIIMCDTTNFKRDLFQFSA